MSISLTEARQELVYIKVDIGEVGEALFLSWCNQIHNLIYRELMKVAAHRFTTEQNYTISASGYQDLPSNYKSIKPHNCGFFVVENGVITDKQLLPQHIGSTSFGYRIQGSRVYFSGISSSKTITLVYLPSLVKFTDEANQYFTIDGTENGEATVTEEFINAIAEHLALLYTRWSEDLDLYGFEDQIFTRALDEMISNYDDTPNIYSPKR